MWNWERENFAGVNFCGTVIILTYGLHNFWVKAVKTKSNIWAKHVIEWVKKKIRKQDMRYELQVWVMRFEF